MEPRPQRLPASGVRVEGIVSGQLGPSVVATATEAPYQLCATGMERVQVTGAGRVVGIRVLRLDRVKIGRGREPWRLLALPVERGLRYEGLPDAWPSAEDRVQRGCPLLVGLHDEPAAPYPSSCPSLGSGDELDRVTTLWSKRVEEMVLAALDDASAQPRDLMIDPGPCRDQRRPRQARSPCPPWPGCSRPPSIRAWAATSAWSSTTRRPPRPRAAW